MTMGISEIIWADALLILFIAPRLVPKWSARFLCEYPGFLFESQLLLSSLIMKYLFSPCRCSYLEGGKGGKFNKITKILFNFHVYLNLCVHIQNVHVKITKTSVNYINCHFLFIIKRSLNVLKYLATHKKNVCCWYDINSNPYY